MRAQCWRSHYSYKCIPALVQTDAAAPTVVPLGEGRSEGMFAQQETRCHMCERSRPRRCIFAGMHRGAQGQHSPRGTGPPGISYDNEVGDSRQMQLRGKGRCSLLTGSRCRSLYVQGLANVDVDGVALDPPPIFRAQSRQGRLPHIRGNH